MRATQNTNGHVRPGYQGRDVTNCWLWACFLGKHLILNSGTVTRSILSSGNCSYSARVSAPCWEWFTFRRGTLDQKGGLERAGYLDVAAGGGELIDSEPEFLRAGGSVISNHGSLISN